MSDVNTIVVSHRGWDGTRIIGVFSDRPTAIEATKNFKLSENEELVFDYLEVNRLSKSAGTTHSGSSIIERHHVYI